MSNWQSGRGGAREGAGRPKGSISVVGAFRRRRYTVRLPQWLIEWLQDQPESAGRIIEKAIIIYHQVKRPDPGPTGGENDI